jgi:hypothetical protein
VVRGVANRGDRLPRTVQKGILVIMQDHSEPLVINFGRWSAGLGSSYFRLVYSHLFVILVYYFFGIPLFLSRQVAHRLWLVRQHQKPQGLGAKMVVFVQVAGLGTARSVRLTQENSKREKPTTREKAPNPGFEILPLEVKLGTNPGFGAL